MYLGAVKVIIFALLFADGARQLLTLETWWFIQNVNLVFHEAGHVIFYLFGSFIGVLGGSILEILIPMVMTLVFIQQKSWFSAACTSWWCMTAWLSVALYAMDAQERLLPLITNDINSHDWHFILTQANLLQYDNFIGGIFWGIAFAFLLFGAVLVVQDKNVRKLTSPRYTTRA